MAQFVFRLIFYTIIIFFGRVEFHMKNEFTAIQMPIVIMEYFLLGIYLRYFSFFLIFNENFNENLTSLGILIITSHLLFIVSHGKNTKMKAKFRFLYRYYENVFSSCFPFTRNINPLDLEGARGLVLFSCSGSSNLLCSIKMRFFFLD